MAKLKDLLEESFSLVGGIVTHQPINDHPSLTDLVEDIYGEAPKKVSANEVLEAVRTFSSIGKQILLINTIGNVQIKVGRISLLMFISFYFYLTTVNSSA